MSDATQAAAARGSLWRFFPWFLMAGLATVVAVNVGMAVLAHRTAPGVAVQGSFATSNAYGRIQQEARRQAGLGWSLDVAHRGRILEVRLGGPDGRPMPGATLEAQASRPAGGGAPVAVVFAETTDGLFRSAIPLPGPGQWDIAFVARADGRSLRHNRRIIVE